MCLFFVSEPQIYSPKTERHRDQIKSLTHQASSPQPRTRHSGRKPSVVRNSLDQKSWAIGGLELLLERCLCDFQFGCRFSRHVSTQSGQLIRFSMFCGGFGRFGVGIHRASESSSLSALKSIYSHLSTVCASEINRRNSERTPFCAAFQLPAFLFPW